MSTSPVRRVVWAECGWCGRTYRIKLPVSKSEQLSKKVAPTVKEEVASHELEDEPPEHAREEHLSQ